MALTRPLFAHIDDQLKAVKTDTPSYVRMVGIISDIVDAIKLLDAEIESIMPPREDDKPNPTWLKVFQAGAYIGRYTSAEVAHERAEMQAQRCALLRKMDPVFVVDSNEDRVQVYPPIISDLSHLPIFNGVQIGATAYADACKRYADAVQPTRENLLGEAVEAFSKRLYDAALAHYAPTLVAALLEEVASSDGPAQQLANQILAHYQTARRNNDA